MTKFNANPLLKIIYFMKASKNDNRFKSGFSEKDNQFAK